MRLQSLLNESNNLDSLVDAFYGILNECQPFLKIMGTVRPPQFMYSGRNSDEKIINKDVRSDRKPMSTFKEIHDDFDNEFNKQFGWRPRSNGLFCTGDLFAAESYGHAYVIFPKGNFKYLWNPSISDLYLALVNYSFNGDIKRSNGLKKFYLDQIGHKNRVNHIDATPKEVTDEVEKEYEDYISSTVEDYKENELMKAIDERNEIMINCKSYYGISWYYFHLELRPFFKNYKNNYHLTKDEIRRIVVNDEEL